MYEGSDYGCEFWNWKGYGSSVCQKGIDLVLVARRVERLEVIRRHFEGKVDIKVIQADLSDENR